MPYQILRARGERFFCHRRRRRQLIGVTIFSPTAISRQREKNFWHLMRQTESCGNRRPVIEAENSFGTFALGEKERARRRLPGRSGRHHAIERGSRWTQTGRCGKNSCG